MDSIDDNGGVKRSLLVLPVKLTVKKNTMSRPRPPVGNPYTRKSTNGALQTAQNNNMGPQSQRRISLLARTHRMASSNDSSNKRQKRDS